MYTCVCSCQPGKLGVSVAMVVPTEQTVIIARYVSADCRVGSNGRWQRLDLAHLLTLARLQQSPANSVVGDANPPRLLHPATGNYK